MISQQALKKMNAVEDEIRELDRCICNGIFWAASPQGFDFWNKVHTTLGSYGSTYMGAPAPPENDIKFIHDAIICLHGAFKWDQSPEGHYFWAEVNTHLSALYNKIREDNNNIVNDDPVDAYDRAMAIL